MARIYLKLLISLAIVSSWHTGAIAACSGSTATLTVDLGTISIGTGSVVTVGSVIKTLQGKWTSYASNSTGACGAKTLISYEMPGAVSAGFSDVHDTNLPGIGMRISVWTVGQSTLGVGGGYYGMPTAPAPLPYQLPLQSFSGQGVFGEGYNQIKVEVIRTGTDLAGGDLLVTGPLLVISDQSGAGGSTTLTNLTVRGTSALKTCSVTTSRLVVDLGTVRMPDVAFSAPAASKAFTIEMTCAASPSIAIQFDGLTVIGNEKVLQLRDGPGVATGIGLQILDSSADPVTFGKSLPLIAAAPTGINKFNFSARYVPIAPHRTPGTADAIATFTMEYN
jgi:type 1 fimbria pilin